VPTVAVIFGLTIMLFYEDHDPAHFHVRGPGFSAKVMLADLSLASVRGELRSRDVRRIREWALRHRAELWDNWLRARRGEPLVAIKG
jgi:hypothetical protein